MKTIRPSLFFLVGGSLLLASLPLACSHAKTTFSSLTPPLTISDVSIQGMVVDVDYLPVSSATIRIQAAKGETLADTDGRLRLKNLEEK